MVTRLNQVAKEEWPKGLSLAVAVLSLEPQQLTEKFDIQFFEDHDDLDSFVAALIRLDKDHDYALVRYARARQAGTEVWVRENCPDVTAQVHGLLDELALSESDLSWLHPELETETKAITVREP